MQITIPTGAAASAFFRHIGSSTAGAVAVIALFVSMTPDQQVAIVQSVNMITDGAQKIIAGVSSLIPILTGIYAAYTTSTKMLAKAVNRNPDLDVVPASPKGEVIVAQVKADEKKE